MARERMATSYPTPPPSRSDNQSEVSFQSHDQPFEGEETTGRGPRSADDDELVTTATKLVAQVLAKVVVEESLRLPSSYDEEINEDNNRNRSVSICTCACQYKH